MRESGPVFRGPSRLLEGPTDSTGHFTVDRVSLSAYFGLACMVIVATTVLTLVLAFELRSTIGKFQSASRNALDRTAGDNASDTPGAINSRLVVSLASVLLLLAFAFCTAHPFLPGAYRYRIEGTNLQYRKWILSSPACVPLGEISNITIVRTVSMAVTGLWGLGIHMGSSAEPKVVLIAVRRPLEARDLLVDAISRAQGKRMEEREEAR